MKEAEKLDHNHELSLKEFPYIIRWRDDRCTRCGRCTAVCPVMAIEPSPHAKRKVLSEGVIPNPKANKEITHMIDRLILT